MTNPLYDALIAPHKDNDGLFLSLDEPGSLAQLCYRDFVQQSARMARVLRDAGIGAGDRVVVQAPKRSEMLALYAACVQTGAVLLPLNTAYKPAEVAYFINDADPGLIVTTSPMAAALTADGGAAAALIHTLDADRAGSLGPAMDAAQPLWDVTPRAADDLAALLYTSGTTGRSKGAMLSQDNLLSNTEVLVAHWRITGADVLIHALPIFHTHGLFVAMNCALAVGAQVKFHPGFDLDAIFRDLDASTLMMGVPTFYTRLLGDARLTPDATASMRLFISGSAPLLAETHKEFTARTGHRILERYGMTETNMNTSNPYEGDRRPGTVGFPLPGTDLRLTDPETGKPVPPGAVGMVEVRGRNVFQGYWRMPEKTAEELRPDGFFITGDLGQIDEDGYLAIVGRQKDLIITGGLNVYPKEVEDVINAVPGVTESAVFGAPHADFGEMIVATIVSAREEQALLAEVRQAVADRLARFKQPQEYHVVAALPRNAMGKVQKAVLRANHTQPDNPA